MTQADPIQTVRPETSPFRLDDAGAYQDWRRRKLAAYPLQAADMMVDLADGNALSADELERLHRVLQCTNFVVYRLAGGAGDKATVLRIGEQLGLRRLDANLCSDEDQVSSIRVVEERAVGEYVPYTDRALNWHTDGYYNALDRQVRGVVLHCARPAAEGGESALLDHEIAYIHLRDLNPDYIRALMAPDAMTIPPNVLNGREIRPLQSGPVFSVDARGCLHMRYSARARNIVWRQDPLTLEAAECLLNLFRSGSPYIFRHRLEAGEGIVSNNALHARSAFRDDASQNRVRLLYRARYLDRVTDTRSRDHAQSQ